MKHFLSLLIRNLRGDINEAGTVSNDVLKYSKDTKKLAGEEGFSTDHVLPLDQQIGKFF